MSLCAIGDAAWLRVVMRQDKSLDGYELLLMATNAGKVDVCEMLVLDEGVVVPNLAIVLRMAVEQGHSRVVELWLRSGADARAKNDELLRIAIENGHTDVAAILREAGCWERDEWNLRGRRCVVG